MTDGTITLEKWTDECGPLELRYEPERNTVTFWYSVGVPGISQTMKRCARPMWWVWDSCFARMP